MSPSDLAAVGMGFAKTRHRFCIDSLDSLLATSQPTDSTVQLKSFVDPYQGTLRKPTGRDQSGSHFVLLVRSLVPPPSSGK